MVIFVVAMFSSSESCNNFRLATYDAINQLSIDKRTSKSYSPVFENKQSMERMFSKDPTKEEKKKKSYGAKENRHTPTISPNSPLNFT